MFLCGKISLAPRVASLGALAACGLTLALSGCGGGSSSSVGNGSMVPPGPTQSPPRPPPVSNALTDPIAMLAADGNNWPGFRHDTQRTGNNPYQTTITKANVATLAPKWTKTTHGIFANPVIVNGIVYQADLGGFLYAWNLSNGSQLWSFANSDSAQFQSTPAYYQNKLYVGDYGRPNLNPAVFRAINAGTGRVLWSFTQTDYKYSSFQSSPLVTHGLVYEGEATNNEISNGCDHNHQLVAFSPYSPTLVSSLNLTPTPANGADIWMSPVMDPTGGIYVDTGNLCGGGPDPYSNAVMKVKAGQPQMGVSWFYQSHACPTLGECDEDFGATPNYVVFNGTPMLVAGGKDGIVYAFNATTGALLWQRAIGDIEAAPSTDGTKVYVPVLADSAASTCTPGQANCGQIAALNLSNGSIAWSVPVTADAFGNGALTATTVSGGMVFTSFVDPATKAPTLWALDSSTGGTLWKYATGSAGVYGGIAVVNGGLLTGVYNGSAYWCFTPGGK